MLFSGRLHIAAIAPLMQACYCASVDGTVPTGDLRVHLWLLQHTVRALIGSQIYLDVP